MALNKKLAALLVCAVVLVVGAVSATLAYFTDNDAAVNTFTVGDVDITLDEADVDDSTPNKDRDTANEYKLIPGNTYTKDPTIHVAKGSDPCWLFVTVKISKEFTAIEASDDASIAAQMKELGWTAISTKDGKTVYAYEASTVSAGNSKAVFKSFTIDGDKADKTAFDKIDTTTMIKVTGYAIQAAGFDTAEEAWTQASFQF